MNVSENRSSITIKSSFSQKCKCTLQTSVLNPREYVLLSFKAVYTLLQAALISFSISWISQPSWHGYQENNGIKVACGGSCFWTFQNAITFKYFRFPLEVRTSAASVYWNGQNQAEMLGFAGLEFWYQVNLDIYRISDLNFVKIGLCCQRLRETHG